ncbi:hypothetical protein PGT21_018937 [Puccinia graminis f. sp. tritici]|uniref:Uncharacterized protein n=1 Tax=Puccinia graminis f. sp. tritici TaxID=56615 RepID=A0A5B0NCT0_PUCGR|nr:hypothetical protein PGT21_018937 [Puccinia graminis f. sp. tritici]KAA1136184.1 hypothetical protein PGTUg99_034488 [Puccinia graminis f. sp. tritici]
MQLSRIVNLGLVQLALQSKLALATNVSPKASSFRCYGNFPVPVCACIDPDGSAYVVLADMNRFEHCDDVYISGAHAGAPRCCDAGTGVAIRRSPVDFQLSAGDFRRVCPTPPSPHKPTSVIPRASESN